MKSTSAFISLLISAGIIYMFILPQYDKVQALRAEASQYQSVMANITALAAKRDALLTQYQDIPSSDVTQLSKILPDTVSGVDLAIALDSIASRYGISITSVQSNEQTQNSSGAIVQDAPPPSPYVPTTATFSFVASYPQFRQFLRGLEQSLRIMDVQSLSFQNGSNGLYTYNFTIQTYSLK